MTETGTIHRELGESRLDAETLAIRGAEDPFGAATDFLAARNIVDGDQATVTGTAGQILGRNVLFMTAAEPAAALAGAAEALTARNVATNKKAVKKAAKKKTVAKVATR